MQNFRGFVGLGDWPLVDIMSSDVVIDIRHQIRYVAKHARAQSVGGQLAEETLDRVEPGGGSWREGNLEARVHYTYIHSRPSRGRPPPRVKVQPAGWVKFEAAPIFMMDCASAIG